MTNINSGKKLQLKGFLFVIVAATMWGISGTVAKFMFNNNVSPFDLVQLRLAFSFLILLTYLLVADRKSLYVPKQDWPYMAIFGFFGVAAVQFTYLFTISQTNVATAIFLQYLAPAFVLIYGVLRGKEKLAALNGSALILALAGGYLIVRGNLSGGLAINSLGLASGIASAISFAFYTVYGKRGLDTYKPWTLLAWGFGVGALVWGLYKAPWLTLMNYNWHTWLFFLYIAIFATILPFGFFFKGLNYLSPVKTGITSTLEPVVAALAAFICLGEILTPVQIIGCILILGAVILIQLKTENKAKEKEPKLY